MKRRRIRFALALGSACAVSVLAFAAGAQRPAGGRRGIGEVCAADAARLCPGTRGVELLLCLEGRSADLSPGCRARVTSRLAQVREHHALVAQACKDETVRFCPDVPPGPGQGLVRCLREHEADLSQACRTQLSPPR